MDECSESSDVGSAEVRGGGVKLFRKTHRLAKPVETGQKCTAMISSLHESSASLTLTPLSPAVYRHQVVWRPGERWVSELCARLGLVSEQLSPQQLAHCVWALAKLDCRPGGATMEALLRHARATLLRWVIEDRLFSAPPGEVEIRGDGG